MSIRSDVIILPPSNKPSRQQSMRSVATGAAAGTHLWDRTAVNVVSSTDATPIVVTMAAGHGFETGDLVTIASHATNVGANGQWRVSAHTSTTITLEGSVGSGAGAGGASGTVNFTNSRPEGKCWVTFEAVTEDCYIRIGPASSAATTTSNGVLVPAGGTVSFYLTPYRDTYVDAYAPGGAGVLKWWVSSPIAERERI